MATRSPPGMAWATKPRVSILDITPSIWLEDLRAAGCDILTLGQYLQPTLSHLPVVEFIAPEVFAAYGQVARRLGFVHVASGPMVRSSYHADEFTLPLARR